MTKVRCLIMFTVLAVTARHAAAQSASAQAETLFREGRELMAAGKFVEACVAFESSHKLEPAATTLVNLGGCQERAGRLATAWGVFVDAGRQLRDATDDRSKELAQIAATRAASLEPRLSKLAINIKPDDQIAGLEVRRGDEVVDAGTWNRPLPIDGGTYTIIARAPGHDEWSTTIRVSAERDSKTIEVPRLAETQVIAPVTPAVSSHKRILPYALGGGAVVLLGSALLLDRSAGGTYDDAKSELTDNTRRQSLYDSANTKRYLAQGVAIAGIGCAGVAVWMYLRNRRESREPIARGRGVVIEPMVASSRGGLVVSGRF